MRLLYAELQIFPNWGEDQIGFVHMREGVVYSIVATNHRVITAHCTIRIGGKQVVKDLVLEPRQSQIVSGLEFRKDFTVTQAPGIISADFSYRAELPQTISVSLKPFVQRGDSA